MTKTKTLEEAGRAQLHETRYLPLERQRLVEVLEAKRLALRVVELQAQIEELRRPRPDEDLKQIARDMIANRVFTSWQVDLHGPLSMIFMPLVFMQREDLWVLQQVPIELIYEYMDKAGPRSINGYPQFFSMRWLNAEDSKKVWGYFEKLRDAMEAL